MGKERTACVCNHPEYFSLFLFHFVHDVFQPVLHDDARSQITGNIHVIPSNALFRQDGQWTVFVAEDDRAQLRPVQIGRNNATQVLEGLEEETQVILYPSSE